MKQQVKLIANRTAAATLALAVAASCGLGGTALAAEPLPSSCDESYYATMDFYGGLIDSSVVKSYRTNGQQTLTDYGAYDQIINLTDDQTPAVGEGTVTFDLGEDAPSRFYFEGKTEQPFRELPWTITLSYQLNGAPAQAEDLAGKTGLVEIDLDVLPNPNASEYSRNNLVLTAATAFNADDILSLEAPGAEVQLIGNLRAVLFMVLPGEEQHFAIRVGSDDFSFPGLVLMAVPATLQQLDQVADLREAKEKTEDSYRAINDSLDVILNTLSGMSGSLNSTANGLEQLNNARSTLSAGKGQVYENTDTALADLSGVADGLDPLDGHLEATSQALTETTETLSALTANTVALKQQLADTRAVIDRIREDTGELRQLSHAVESYNGDARKIAKNLGDDMDDLSGDLDTLQRSLSSLSNSLGGTHSISGVGGISVNGMSVGEIKAAASAAQAAYGQYTDSGAQAGGLSFADFLVQFGGKSETEAAQIAGLYAQSQTTDFQDKISQAETADGMIDNVNDKIGEVNSLVDDLAQPAGRAVSDLESLCATLGGGMSEDLQRLTRLCTDLLDDMDDHAGTVPDLLVQADELGALATQVSENADTALDLIQSLDDTVNTYEPQAQQALTDARALAGTTLTGLRDTHTLFASAEDLLRQSGPSLDAGTQQSLSGLANALRRSTTGLEQTGTLKNAKNTLTTLIDDEWDSHTGGENNLLLMDAGAAPLSLTDQRNGTPTSIQYIMRTQEIKVEEPDSDVATDAATGGEGTVWSRIGDMFRDFWSTITGVFHKG